MTSKETYEIWHEIIRPYTGIDWWPLHHPKWMEKEVRTAGLVIDATEVSGHLTVTINLLPDA